jgi:hypothetical protein
MLLLQAFWFKLIGDAPEMVAPPLSLPLFLA